MERYYIEWVNQNGKTTTEETASTLKESFECYAQAIQTYYKYSPARAMDSKRVQLFDTKTNTVITFLSL